MGLSTSRKRQTVTPERALPGRAEARTAVPRWARAGGVRDGVLLGRRAHVLEAAWRLHHGRGICRWPDIYTTSPEQAATAHRVAERFGEQLRGAGYRAVMTEIAPAEDFYYAEPYQQYLAADPGGYCGLGGTGVSCPDGLAGAG